MPALDIPRQGPARTAFGGRGGARAEGRGSAVAVVEAAARAAVAKAWALAASAGARSAGMPSRTSSTEGTPGPHRAPSSMFDALKKLLDGMAPRFAGPSTPAAPSVHLAAAVLLMEVMRAESTISVEERAAAVRGLRTQFGLSQADIAPLLDGAERETQAAYDYFRFTNVLNDQLSQPQKIALVEAMWRAAYADLHLDPAENAVINQVAGLLHVTHGDYIAAKLRAQLPV